MPSSVPPGVDLKSNQSQDCIKGLKVLVAFLPRDGESSCGLAVTFFQMRTLALTDSQ